MTIVVRRRDLAETMSDYLIRDIRYNDVIHVEPCTTVADGGGDSRLQWVTLRNIDTGKETRHDVGGLLLLLGAQRHCDWLPDSMCRDDRGFVVTGRDIPKHLWPGGTPPANLETTVPGVFAAGDILSASMKRVAAASGEGPRSSPSCTSGSRAADLSQAACAPFARPRPARRAGPRAGSRPPPA